MADPREHPKTGEKTARKDPASIRTSAIISESHQTSATRSSRSGTLAISTVSLTVHLLKEADEVTAREVPKPATIRRANLE
jgi:hypothetical protein